MSLVLRESEAVFTQSLSFSHLSVVVVLGVEEVVVVELVVVVVAAGSRSSSRTSSGSSRRSSRSSWRSRSRSRSRRRSRSRSRSRGRSGGRGSGSAIVVAAKRDKQEKETKQYQSEHSPCTCPGYWLPGRGMGNAHCGQEPSRGHRRV